MALTVPAGMNAQLLCIPLAATRQLTGIATTADATTFKPGFAGRVVGISGTCGAVGGTTAPTDIDLMVEKGTTDLLQAALAVADSSAVVSGGAVGTLTATTADLEFTATDVFHLDIAGTAGTSLDGTVDDCVAYLWVVRE